MLDIPAAPVKRRRWLLSPVLIVSIVLHVLFGVGAAVYVVSRYTATRKLTFQGGPKSPNPSERALQHRVQMERKMQTQSVPAAVPKRVLTTGLAKVQLPPMPDIQVPKTAANAPTMAAGGQAGAFAPAAALGGGAIGGTGSGSPINFFGIRDVSTSVLIMIDVSASMFTRTGDAEGPALLKLGKEQSFQAVRDEATKLIQSLTPATRFGIVRWAGSAISWKPELVSASEENKQAAIEHIQNEVDFGKAKPRGRPGGTRHDYALEEAFKLKPETIYMLTDGNATATQEGGGLQPIPNQDIWKVAEEGQKTLAKKAKLHVIYYVTAKEKDEERHMLQGLTSRSAPGSQFRQVQAAAVKKGSAEVDNSKQRQDRKDAKDDKRGNKRKR